MSHCFSDKLKLFFRDVLNIVGGNSVDVNISLRSSYLIVGTMKMICEGFGISVSEG